MPKIYEISIRIGPGKNETIPSVTLLRDLDKQWSVINENGFPRGLFGSEINLAYMLQNLIISKWGGSE